MMRVEEHNNIKEKYIIEISRYTRGKYCRIGHYRIYCLSEGSMYDETKDLANFYKRKYDRRGCISIKEGGRAGIIQIEEMVREYYGLGTHPGFIYIIGEK